MILTPFAFIRNYFRSAAVAGLNDAIAEFQLGVEVDAEPVALKLTLVKEPEEEDGKRKAKGK